MKKKLAIGVLSVVLLVGGATAAFAATDSSKLDEIKSLTQQVFGIQKQIADKEVEAGIITQAQADAMKSSIDLRQQYSTQAIASGQVFGPGMGRMRGGMMYNNGQPMTDDQLKAWDSAAQARLQAQAQAMKANGLTDDQVKAWTDAMQAQIKVQEDALMKGTFVSGGMGMHGGMGGGRGMHGGFWGYNTVPSAGTSSSSNTQ
ncbi:DUF2680 domain-containing protein [Desulfosporosinus sp. FKB]|uniref:DUF2680 domain-containing protein n=1 Tax=Desulfosporosinus sp. FKB TaxID=1969835 RepID=UPI000B49F048|nr:DUF2680 domain-containing protein [Desulfosporosinus sp. FKB]